MCACILSVVLVDKSAFTDLTEAIECLHESVVIMSGSESVWISECVDQKVCGSVSVWISECGSVSVWISECVDQ